MATLNSTESNDTPFNVGFIIALCSINSCSVGYRNYNTIIRIELKTNLGIHEIPLRAFVGAPHLDVSNDNSLNARTMFMWVCVSVSNRTKECFRSHQLQQLPQLNHIGHSLPASYIFWAKYITSMDSKYFDRYQNLQKFSISRTSLNSTPSGLNYISYTIEKLSLMCNDLTSVASMEYTNY